MKVAVLALVASHYGAQIALDVHQLLHAPEAHLHVQSPQFSQFLALGRKGKEKNSKVEISILQKHMMQILLRSEGVCAPEASVHSGTYGDKGSGVCMFACLVCAAAARELLLIVSM